MYDELTPTVTSELQQQNVIDDLDNLRQQHPMQQTANQSHDQIEGKTDSSGSEVDMNYEDMSTEDHLSIDHKTDISSLNLPSLSVAELQSTIEELQLKLLQITKEKDDWQAKAEEATALLASNQPTPETVLPSSAEMEFTMTSLLEKYEKLKGRVEELKNERDSYREAMMKVFDDANPAASGKNNHTGSNNNGKSTTSLSGFMNSNKQLQEHITLLSRQNHELKQLEKLRPQLMELQQQLANSQEENFKQRTKAAEEIALLTDKYQELLLQFKTSNRSLDAAAAELSETRQFAENMSEKVDKLLDREQQLLHEIECLQRDAQEMALKAVDPAKLKEVEEKLSEAIGERKHWQSKAQSLSKDMQRMMGLASELVQLKEENGRIQHRLEEVEAEKCAFREAMQKAMAERNPNSSGVNSNTWF